MNEQITLEASSQWHVNFNRMFNELYELSDRLEMVESTSVRSLCVCLGCRQEECSSFYWFKLYFTVPRQIWTVGFSTRRLPNFTALFLWNQFRSTLLSCRLVTFLARHTAVGCHGCLSCLMARYLRYLFDKPFLFSRVHRDEISPRSPVAFLRRFFGM